MTKQIYSGIAAGQVPEGYKLEHGYVIPKEWKVVHFNECFHRLTQKNTENNQNVLTISAQQGLISQLDYYNTPYASEDKTGYFLLQKGNFAYNKSYSADYAYGESSNWRSMIKALFLRYISASQLMRAQILISTDSILKPECLIGRYTRLPRKAQETTAC